MTYVTTQIWVPRIGCAARKFVSTNHAEALHTSGQCHTDSKKPNLNTFHHIYRTDAQLSQYSINLSAKWDAKHVFCYLDFCSHLKANDPNCFHFRLKVLLSSKFMVKSTYRSTPKMAAKKKQQIKGRPYQIHLEATKLVAWKPTTHLDITLDDIKAD